jgi:ATP-dependent helicase/nuclease subunit A
VALRESRRSGPGVLSVVNAFADRDFAPPGEPRDFELRYGAVEHLVAAEPRREPGDGEVIVVRDDGQSSDALPPLVREATGAARNGFVAAAMVLREARRSGVPFRDIAVLTRRRASLPFVELGLARLGVPYVVAGRALYDTREVRDVAALLRLLLDPRDKLALATVLRGPAVALSEQSLARLARPGRGLVVPLTRDAGRDEPDEDAPRLPLEREEAARLHTFRTRFEGVRPAALRASPGTAIQLVVRAFGLDEVLACLERGAAQLGNVDRLSAIARARGGSVAAFVRWLEARIADQTDEAEAAVFSPEDDAVRLTTIHASKGLDFPVVVLLDLDAAGAGESSGFLFRPSSQGEPPLFAMRHAVPHPLPSTSGMDVSPSLTITPAALREARAETAARGIAERARLTYVGMTRARRTLVLIQGTKIPKANNAARTLQGLLEDPLTQALFARVDDAGLALREAEALASQPSRDASPGPELPDQRAEPKTLTIATTPLSLFEGCARRYRFRQLLGLDEPLGSGQLDLFAEATPSDERAEGEVDPRIVGRAAHRVLERWPAERWGEEVEPAELAAMLVGEGLDDDEGTAHLAADLARVLSGGYARRVREEGARLVREEPFVLELGEEGGVTLALRGAIDLCVSRRDGSLDVLDYKLTRPRADLSAYTFQLRAYALAMARRTPGRPIRAGVLFLRGAGEPTALPGASPGGHWSDAEHAQFAQHLGELAQRYADARRDERWDGVPVARCRALGCGFLRACHGELAGRAARGPVGHIG